MARELARLTENGRIVVPARMRRALGIDKGDAVWLDLRDGELRLRPARSALRRLQAQLQPYAAERRPASEEIVADRRIEAAGE